MYRSDLDAKDKSGAIAAVALVHVALLLVLIHLSGKLADVEPQAVLRVFDLSEPQPQPPPTPPPAELARAKAKQAEGGSAPPNIKSQASPVVAPTPRILLPVPQPVTAARTPAQGTAPTQGASTVAGTGTGAGGTGNGTGSGSGGNGPGGGGDGGVAEPPHLATPVLTGREIPRDLIDRWPPGLPVFLRLRVNPQGYVSECNVLRGTGNASIDGVMCNIAHDQLRFQPALDRSGQPVAGWFGYAQRPPR
jgi:protein TonB